MAIKSVSVLEDELKRIPTPEELYMFYRCLKAGGYGDGGSGLDDFVIGYEVNLKNNKKEK